MGRRPSATVLLGAGGLLIVLLGVITALVRSPSPSHHHAAVVEQQVAVSSPAGQYAQKPATPHHRARHASARQHTGTHGQPTTLPFTGPQPVPPTIAFGLLLVASGSWLLGRYPAVVGGAVRGLSALARSGRRRRPPRDGAIDRLRSRGQFL